MLDFAIPSLTLRVSFSVLTLRVSFLVLTLRVTIPVLKSLLARSEETRNRLS